MPTKAKVTARKRSLYISRLHVHALTKAYRDLGRGTIYAGIAQRSALPPKADLDTDPQSSANDNRVDSPSCAPEEPQVDRVGDCAPAVGIGMKVISVIVGE